MDKQALLRVIPRVDDLLRAVAARPEAAGISHALLLKSAREITESLRERILRDTVEHIPDDESVTEEIVSLAKKKSAVGLRPLINATGIVLHTNFGRAMAAEAVVEYVRQVAVEYSTLEYDVEEGCRGSRLSHVEKLLCRITGCEAAIAVNNNAAAVFLALSALCAGREVVVSRGELVEIGGSFRIPDIMRQSGAILREVGTTNKTRVTDYAAAVSPSSTAAFLKVHTSNYRIVGFTQDVTISELSALGKDHGIPVIHDLGSGLMVDGRAFGLDGEPTVRDSVAAGADIVCFSGDKLFGGPQAGIVTGKSHLIQTLRQHPLYRVLRMDKLTLAALEATLRLYADPEEAKRKIPVLAMLSMDNAVLEKKARKLLSLLAPDEKTYSAEIAESAGEAGGGSFPGQSLSSWAVAVCPYAVTVNELEERLRKREIPIIGYIAKDRYWMDVRTLDEQRHYQEIRNAYLEIFQSEATV